MGIETGGPSPEEITGVSPIIEQQQEMPPIPAEQQEVPQVSVEPKMEEVRQSEPQPRPHKSKLERRFDMFVEEDEKRKKSPVEEGAPKSEFEKGLVEALKDPETAHEVALAIKPMEDLIVEKKADIRGLFTEVEEIRKRAGELEKLPNEDEAGFEKRRDKIYKEARNRSVELEERMGLMKDFLWTTEGNERAIIDSLEKIRLAKLAGGDEPHKAGEGLFVRYVGTILSTRKRKEESAEIDRRANYRDVMNEGQTLDKILLWLRQEEYKYEKKPEEMLLPELIKDKIDRMRALSKAEAEARKVVSSLGIEGVDSMSYEKIIEEMRKTNMFL